METVHPVDDPVAELRRSEERLQAVIEASPVAILEVDLDTRVVRWNPAAEQIYGWRADEVLGQPPPFVPESHREEFEHLLGEIRGGRAYTGIETVRRRRDGSLVDVEISAAPVRDARGAVTSHIVVFSDISRRKLQERELRELNGELARRLGDLADSRRRIVTAADTERQLLERNLHDGAQQRLVTLSLTLRLSRSRLASDPEAAAALLEEAAGELAEALEELRELARGIHPAILTERGLEVALDALAARAPLPVELTVPPGERLPEPVEAAVYYLVAESLTNVVKYAGAGAATVTVGRHAGQVTVEVADDGVGGADPAAGSGLRGLIDRVEALRGALEVESARGAGTRIRATLPLDAA